MPSRRHHDAAVGGAFRIFAVQLFRAAWWLGWLLPVAFGPYLAPVCEFVAARVRELRFAVVRSRRFWRETNAGSIEEAEAAITRWTDTEAEDLESVLGRRRPTPRLTWLWSAEHSDLRN